MIVPTVATLAQLSNALMYSATAVYLVAVLFFAADALLRLRSPAAAPEQVPVMAGGLPDAPTSAQAAVFNSLATPARARRLSNVAVAQTLLGFGLHGAAVVTRGLAAERVPFGNMYEFMTAAALVATAAYLVLLRRHSVPELGLWMLGAVTVAQALALTVFYTPAGALVPALNSYWLAIHVTAAIFAGGVFTLGAAATVLYLLRSRADRRGAGRYTKQLPAADTLDKIARGAHLVAFPVWTFAVIAGAIWAEESWGRYWGWDPKETWAFVTWMLYAAYLHADATAGWRGRRAAWFAIAGYVAFLFNFVGVNLWINGLHSYAGV